MAKGRRLTPGIAFRLAAAAVVCSGIACWRPLGRPRLVEHVDSMSQSSMQQFLDRDFRIVRDMKALPEPVVKAFTEEGGSRLTIANPGERFEATDVMTGPWDESVPRMRLLFAGISGDKSFVLYERGGIGLSHILALFQLGAASTTPAMWQTYCVPAASLEELRAHISQGKCSRPTQSRRPR